MAILHLWKVNVLIFSILISKQHIADSEEDIRPKNKKIKRNQKKSDDSKKEKVLTLLFSFLYRL